LDENFHAKLSDFGISRLINTDKTLYTENVIGSIGYMDPLFARDGLLTSKSDVYSFGVVLLELIARKKATTVPGNVNNVSAFTNALSGGGRGAREMFDTEIAGKDSMKIVEGVAKIAGECLIMEREKRPEMIDVVERLRVLRKALQQDRGQNRLYLLSWVSKSKRAPPAVVTIPAKSVPSGLCRQFSLAEMKTATNNFSWSLCVGEGAFGPVFSGKINGGKTKVAIKRRNQDSMHGEHEFHTEIEMSSKILHRNVVPLVGYCDEMGEMILVYNYMDHGCLRDHLYGTKKPPLTWNRRLGICIGAAWGLHSLHASHVIYRNLKTTDILLDEEWVAELSDLALCKIGPPTDVMTRVIGSGCGVLDPEYVRTGRLTEKSDVYSFGGVLLEVLCARSVLDITLPKEQAILVDWALQSKKEGKLNQIVDPCLEGSIDQRSLEKFVGIAEKCLASEGVNRPSMGDVLLDLELALGAQGTVQG
jgi:serine/threonine protein kinase